MRILLSLVLAILCFVSKAEGDENCLSNYSLVISNATSVIVDDGPLDSSDLYRPASTFKIPHTLIAVDKGLFNRAEDVFVWDGVVRSYQPWNQDQTLKSAFQVSCVWCYQELVSQIGENEYFKYLNLLGYGNKMLGKNLEKFWLDGELKISPREQVGFLRNIYFHRLDISDRSYKVLKEIMYIRDFLGGRLYGKTGWASDSGWFVGYYEKHQKVYFFANQVKITKQADLQCRRSIVLEALGKLAY